MTATLVRIFFGFALVAPAQALAARSDWSAADQAQLRLLLSHAAAGPIEGGIEISLEPGWHTYWRTPGDAGVPPVFDFAGSRNVASVEVLYPAPERYDDGASVSLVYRDGVVFPLAVSAQDPGEPVQLRVKASFGVCREICIPTQTESELTLPPSADPDPLTRAVLSRFQPRVPKTPEPGRFDIQSVAVEPGAVVVDVQMPESSYLDLFAEPPPGWSVGQPVLVSRLNGVSRFRLAVSEQPVAGGEAGQTFRFTAVAGGEVIEKAVEVR